MKRSFASWRFFGLPLFHPVSITIILNCIIFLVQLFYMEQGNYYIENVFGLNSRRFLAGFYWQIFTYGFLHGSFSHIMLNMFALYVFGKFLTREIGTWKFMSLYFVSILTGGIAVILFDVVIVKFFSDTAAPVFSMTIGASGGIFGLLYLWGLVYPEAEMLLLFIIPVKSKHIAAVSILLGVVLERFFHIPLSNTGHIGGLLGGIVFCHLFYTNIHIRGTIIDRLITDRTESEKVQTSNDDAVNLKIITDLNKMKTAEEMEAYLISRQVKNANICPPGTFNVEDSYCLKCDWFSNCMLNKVRGKD